MADETGWTTKEMVERLETAMTAGQARIEAKIDALSIRIGRIEEWMGTERYAQKNHVRSHEKLDSIVDNQGRRLGELADKQAKDETAQAVLQNARQKFVEWRRWAVPAALTAVLAATSILTVLH